MKTLIVILIIASFLQSTIFPIDLVLIILICRAFIKREKPNLYLAFAFGLLISHLALNPLGLNAVIFLLLIQITESLSKSRLANNSLLIVPICFVLLSLNQVVVSLVTQKAIALTPVILGSILSLPIFYLVRFWEERFIVRNEIRLKV